MTTGIKGAQGFVRALGFMQTAIGILLWMGQGLRPPLIHIALGCAFVLALWALAFFGARARVAGGLVALLAAWGVLVAAFGMMHAGFLPGPQHWVIQATHLVIGIIAIGLAEMVAARAKRMSRSPESSVPRSEPSAV